MLHKLFKGHVFLKNFSYLIAGNITSRAINMVTNVIVARWLEPAGYGLYSLVLTYVSLYSAIASLGLQYIINKLVARNQDNSRKFFYICLVLRCIGYLIAVVVFLFSDIASFHLDTIILYAVLIGIFCDSLWGGLQSIAFGMQRMEWNSIIDVSTAALTLFTYILLQLSSNNLITVETVTWIYIGIYIIKNITYWGVLEKTHLITGNYSIKSIQKKECKTIIRESSPFYILVLMGLFTNQLPIVFLEDHSGINEVAYFNTANKLLLPLTILLSNALTALFPNQSQSFVQDREKFWRTSKQMLLIIIIGGSLLAFSVSVLKDDIVWLLYGQNYNSTGNVMAYQCWYIVLFAVFSLNGNILGAADKQKILMVESIVYAVITTPIIYYGSFYGADGLSISYVIASVINLFYLYYILHKISKSIFNFRTVIISLFILLFFSCFAYLIPSDTTIIVKVGLIVLIWLLTYRFYVAKRKTWLA